MITQREAEVMLAAIGKPPSGLAEFLRDVYAPPKLFCSACGREIGPGEDYEIDCTIHTGNGRRCLACTKLKRSRKK